MDLRALTASFREHFDGEPRVFRAPGRVNLIGEHTDYNDGFVLPMALELNTYVAAAAREDRRVRAFATLSGELLEVDLDAPWGGRQKSWHDYVEGMARSVDERIARLPGADLVIASDVPVGAGLSSSAALEVSVGFALATLAGAEIDRKALALAGQKAEHEYVGIKSGIMDQTIAALGRARHALLIDCRSLETELVSVDLADADVVICDTRVKHSLASSEYNTRQQECREGVRILGAHLPGITALRDVSVADFKAHASHLPDPVRRRVRHVVTENARTLEAVEALRRNDLVRAGKLMVASHESLRVDYEVSSEELDLLVKLALEIDGTLGARMTGGGFGGCTVNLVRRSAVEAFTGRVSAGYQDATGIEARIFVSGAGDGAAEVAPE